MKVKFVPQNVEFEIKPGQSVMHLAQDNALYIKSVCKGIPSCAECRVRVIDGEHNVLPPASEELALIGTGHFIDRRRLSCQLKCFGDVTIDMNEQVAKQSGLIGKKTKRSNVKDDRVEQSVAIRSEIQAEEISDEVLSHQVSIEDQPVHIAKSGPRPAGHGPRPNGSGPQGGGQRQNRSPQGDRPAQAQRQPRQGGDSRPARQESARPEGSRGPNPQPQGGAGAEDAGPEDGASRKPRRRRRGGRGKGPGGGGSSSGPSGGGGGGSPGPA